MLDANPIHIWKHQTKTNHFQHVSNFFLSFCVFYRPDKNDAIKLFFPNNSKSKTVRMFILHALINNCTFWQSFSLIISFLCILQTRTIFPLLDIKIRSANQYNFKLSQLGDFIMPSQSWKHQLKRLTTAVFISLSVFCESGSKWPCKADVIIFFSLIPGIVYFAEGSYFAHTLHLISSIVLQSFNVMISFLSILQTRTVFRGFGLQNRFHSSKKTKLTHAWDFIFFATPCKYQLRILISSYSVYLCLSRKEH